MHSRLAAVMLASGALFTMAACDDARAPGAPSTPSVAHTTTRPAFLRVTGPTTISQPGEAAQLAAVATFADGTEQSVTAEAAWSPRETPAVVMTGQGLYRALSYGAARITAAYRGVAGSVDIRVGPAGSWLIAGAARSASGMRLAGVAVEMSSSAGTFRAETDDSGAFLLPALGDTEVRADARGFARLTTAIAAVQDTLVDLAMTRAAGASPITGNYRLTVAASRSCSLPAEAMERQYDAVVEESPRGITVWVPGEAMVAWGGQAGFIGQQDADALTFSIKDTFDDGFNMIERLPSLGDLYLSGTASARVAGGTIVGGAFQGQLKLRPAWGVGITGDCTATDHRLEFSR